MTFTGHTVKRIRREMDLDQATFARMLLVHTSTVYRWEAARGKKITIDPIHRELLELLRDQIGSGRIDPGRLGILVRQGLQNHGTIGGLFMLVRDLV